jgi:hypothetical protein
VVSLRSIIRCQGGPTVHDDEQLIGIRITYRGGSGWNSRAGVEQGAGKAAGVDLVLKAKLLWQLSVAAARWSYRITAMQRSGAG